VKAVLVDSGFLLALGIARDPRHQPAKEFLSRYRGKLLVPAPVVVETCYFFSTSNKVRMLDWLAGPRHKVLDLPAAAYPQLGAILTRYASLDPDFTDAAIVWAAMETGCSAILTVDTRDFGVYRLKRNKRFELVRWFPSNA